MIKLLRYILIDKNKEVILFLVKGNLVAKVRHWFLFLLYLDLYWKSRLSIV